MWERVWAFVREWGMLQPEDRVVVALSGGGDSVCLLAVLVENQIGLRLRAVHVHHGIRGEEANRDVEFVRGLCGELGVPLKVVYRDVPGYGREQGLSLEEAGRKLRYEALEEEARGWETEKKAENEQEDNTGKREHGDKGRPVWIALAHHRDDNAETILHHLFRGSGLRGVAGIQPVQGNRIRPLLGVGKQEIFQYLESNGFRWCEDSTNESKDYTRNRIRRELIPYVTENVNRRAVENVLRAGQIFGQADQYLANQAKRLWDKFGKEERQGDAFRAVMALDVFREQEPIIRTYLIRHMIELTVPELKDITFGHFEQIAHLAEGKVGGRWDLPGGMKAIRTYGEIGIEKTRGTEFGKEEEELPEKRHEEFMISLPDLGNMPLQVGNMEFRVFSRDKGTEIPKKEYTKWFDYDRIKDTLSIRFRHPGDFLTLAGGQRKTLRRFLIDEKIPRMIRGKIPLLAEGNHVLWVVGYRISEYYKIVEDTHTILQVEFYGGKGYGG